ncbi:hypothetical protein BG004_007300 [Podila humilis]|nr:hypothetical protein BG004_007300 [Podila humilis]
MDEEPQEPTSTPTTAATPTPVVGLQHTLNPASNPASIERPGITDDDNDDDDDDDMNESTEAGRTTTRRSGVSPTDNRHYLDGQSTSTTRSDRDDHPIDTSSAMDIDEDEEVMMHGGGGSSSSRSNNTSYPGSISSGSASSGLRSTLATWTNGQGSTTTTTTITTAVAPPTTGSTSSSSTPPPPLIEPSSTGAAAASSSSTSSGGGGTSTTTTTTTTTTPTATTGSGSKSSAPVVDEKAQSELRRKIMEIQRDPNIAFAAKAGMIQKLMSSKWHSQQTPGTQKDDDEADVEASEDDLKTTYYNAELGQLGCKHYRRGCKLKANCCGKWFNCRFCHDDVCDHAIVR